MKFEYQELGQAAIQIIDGDRGKNYPSGSEFFSDGYCLFLNAKNVTADGFSFSERMFISEEKDKLLRKGKLQRKDTVLTTRGTVGNVAYFSNDVPYPNIRINSGMVIIRAAPDVFDSEFVYWLFRSNIVQNQILQLCSGTAQPQLPISSMQRLKIPVPSLHTQKTIVSIIGTLQRKIKLNQRINDNLQQQARMLFKSWFVDFIPFGGKVPDDWEYINFVEFLTPSTLKSNDLSLPMFSVTDNGIFPREEKFKKNLSMANAKSKIVRQTDLVFGMSREILNWGIMRHPIGGVSSAYNVYQVDEQINCFYLESYMKANYQYFKDLIRPASREGQGIDKNALMQKVLLIPSQTVLEQYYLIENALTQTADHVLEENRRLAEIRDTLLPKLMSGEIDVSNVNH